MKKDKLGVQKHRNADKLLKENSILLIHNYLSDCIEPGLILPGVSPSLISVSIATAIAFITIVM